jgi:hypothetical protein
MATGRTRRRTIVVVPRRVINLPRDTSVVDENVDLPSVSSNTHHLVEKVVGPVLSLTRSTLAPISLTSFAQPSFVPTSPWILHRLSARAPNPTRLLVQKGLTHGITSPPSVAVSFSSLAAFSRTSARRPVMNTLAPFEENPSAMAEEHVSWILRGVQL